MNAFDYISPYFFSLIISLTASFLTWVLFLIAVYNVLKLEQYVGRHRLIIQMCGLALALMTFAGFAIGFDSINLLFDPSILIVVVPYTLCLAASIHFYKLPQLYTEFQENPIT